MAGDTNDDAEFLAFEHFLDRNERLFTEILTDIEEHPNARYVLGCEIFEGLKCVTFGDNGPHPDAMNEMWVNAPAATFFAQRINWTREPEPAPTKDSWLVTIVVQQKPAVFFVKNVEDELWDPMPPTHAPWFAVSTAGAMRRAAEKGEILPPMLTATRDEVLKTPSEMPIPPVNDEGIVG